MKKIMKKRIFLMIFLCIICCSIGVFAATTYKATDVLYTSSDGTSMNVNDALNELYSNSNRFKKGTAVYYNPVSGSQCKASEAVSTAGTKTGCMKWYIFQADINNNYTMILDHNTTAGIAWNTSNKNVAYINSNLKAEVDKLVSVSKWVDTPRLISADEVAQITGNTNFDSLNSSTWYYLSSNSSTQTATSKGANTYSWLQDYTNNCTVYGCNIADSSNYGYWTSTPYGISGSSSYVWLLNSYGRLDIGLPSYTDIGIRPVITIPKSRLS